MRTCPICQLAFRANDPGGTCTVPPDNSHNASPGHYSACSECCAAYEALPHFLATVAQINTPYDWSEGVPGTYFYPLSRDGEKGIGNAPPWYCDCCRRCAREDDHMEGMRLYPEDAPDEPNLFPVGQCAKFNDAVCTVCGHADVYQDACPACPRDPNTKYQMKRVCDWHGPFQDPCPKCSGPTVRREAVYYACGECRRKYAPAILARLQRTYPTLPAYKTLTVEAIVSNPMMLA